MPLNLIAGPTCDQSLVDLANAIKAAFAGFAVNQTNYAQCNIMGELDGDVLVLMSGSEHLLQLHFGANGGEDSHINMPGVLLEAWRAALGVSYPLPGSPQVYPIRQGSANYNVEITGGVTNASNHVYWLTATAVVGGTSTTSSDPYVQPLLE